MTSKELVPLHSKELVRSEDASPCPLFDAEVRAVLADLSVLVKDRTIYPDDRRAGLQYDASKLRSLVNKVEAGDWPEDLPEPVLEDEPETQILAGTKSVLDWTPDDWTNKWSALVKQHRVFMADEHRAGLEDGAQHRAAMRRITDK